jgi:D-alanine-D-alanine ligase
VLKSNRRIEIVRSTTRGLSSLSRASSDAILTVLSQHFTEVGVAIVNDLSDLETLVATGPDLVFLGMQFISIPHKVWLSDFFDEHDIAYTGSSQTAHELERNKPLAKRHVLEAGLKTAAFCVIKQDQSVNQADVPLAFPLFIKPANRGGGLGIDSDSVAHSFEQLQAKAHSITTRFKTDSLVEEYLPGREFSVAILKDEYSSNYLSMPIELIAPPDKGGTRMLSCRVKSANSEQALEVTDEILKFRVATLALDVFHALGARDYGRIDIRLDEAGIPHFLEANLIPSLIDGYGSFPKACVLNIDLEYEPMLLRIAHLGLARSIAAIEAVLEPALASPGAALEAA